MTYHLNKNTSSTSTTWRAEVDKIGRPPARAKQNGPKAPLFRSLRRRDAREVLTIRVRYRGGSEAWWLIEGRGTRQAFPGHMCLHDVLSHVNGTDVVK